MRFYLFAAGALCWCTFSLHAGDSPTKQQKISEVPEKPPRTDQTEYEKEFQDLIFAEVWKGEKPVAISIKKRTAKRILARMHESNSCCFPIAQVECNKKIRYSPSLYKLAQDIFHFQLFLRSCRNKKLLNHLCPEGLPLDSKDPNVANQFIWAREYTQGVVEYGSEWGYVTQNMHQMWGVKSIQKHVPPCAIFYRTFLKVAHRQFLDSPHS